MALLLPNNSFLKAEDYSNSSFIVRDPVVTVEGGRSSSSSFEIISSIGQTVVGEITTSSFIQRSGFLFFPVATTSVVSATAGNAQVALTWTAAVGTLANVTTYDVGVATSSGGTYTYESAGNVLAFTKTGLTNGTAYFFKVRAKAGALVLTESAVVSGTPAAPVTPSPAPSPSPSPGGGGGGGGGGSPTPVVTQVIFTGRAYPKSTVTLLKDAQVATTTIAGVDAHFQTSVSGLSAGNYIFSLYSEDRDGRRSSLLSFPVSVTSGATTNVSGIFIAPTIAVDKSEVKRGDDIAIFGQSASQADITISVNSEEEFFAKTISDKDGIYLYNFDTSVLENGSHNTKSKASIGNQSISGYSALINFKVGTQNVSSKTPTVKCPAKADLNSDCRVNLVDFSIAAFWYKRPLSAAFKLIETAKLNGDGKVDLTDFSIMAYYWTG